VVRFAFALLDAVQSVLSRTISEYVHGGCPGTRDSNTCSGITQNTWDFSHLLEQFTS
jgi:hypothetical protein